MRRKEFPKGFLSRKRKEENMKEALKDVIPVKWEKR